MYVTYRKLENVTLRKNDISDLEMLKEWFRVARKGKGTGCEIQTVKLANWLNAKALGPLHVLCTLPQEQGRVSNYS